MTGRETKYRITIGHHDNEMRQTETIMMLSPEEAFAIARAAESLDRAGGAYGEKLTIEYETEEMQPVKVWKKVRYTSET